VWIIVSAAGLLVLLTLLCSCYVWWKCCRKKKPKLYDDDDIPLMSEQLQKQGPAAPRTAAMREKMTAKYGTGARPPLA
jgi:hypothetical protein